MPKNKEKKAKDPSMPKRAKTAYLVYGQEVREEVKRSLGSDAKVTDVMSEIASRWKQLSSEEKKPYDEIARQDKERYERESAKHGGAKRFEQNSLFI